MNLFLMLGILCLFSPLFSDSSTSSELAALQGEPSALVHGCVNALTGDLVLDQQDCIVKGAQPLYFPRRYISREADHPHLKWRLLNYSTAIVELDVSIRVIVPEPSGISLLYLPEKGAIKRDKKGLILTLPLELNPHPDQFHAGLIRQQDSLYHPITNKVILNENTLKVCHTDGSYRVYTYFNAKTTSEDSLNVYTRTTTQMILDHERLGSGHFIHYTWEAKGKFAVLKAIKTSSPKGVEFASASVDVKKGGGLYVTTSDASNLKYKYRYIDKMPFLLSAKTPEYPREKWVYNKQRRLKQKIFPDGRYLQIKYKKNGKVRRLIGPEGKLCSFEYYGNVTEVVDFHGNKTLYYFDPNQLRLRKIETFQGLDKLLKIEFFSWDQVGNLLSKKISSDETLATYLYTYDVQGKLKSQTQLGAIMSKKNEETYSTHYTYNDQNLLVEQIQDNGVAISYTYLEGTNLTTSKTTVKNGHILKRIFYEYNEDHILISEIIDDGPEYTLRKIKRITPKSDAPFYGMPEIVEELYQDGSNERLLKKIHLTYDDRGNVIGKSTYDSQGDFCYREESHYNSKGQIEREIDAEGYSIHYAYDQNGNKTEEISPLGLKTIYTYDTLNRCTRKQEENSLNTFHTFTLEGKPTLSVDPMGGVTKTQYNALGYLIAKTDPQGFTAAYVHNALGQLKKVTDPRGFTTKIRYNLYGNPLRVIHPDGSQEHYTYDLDGKKLSYTDQNATTTHYHYDDFGNIIRESTYHNDQCICQVERKFNAFHLLEEIDSEGLRTTYTYGSSGRLKKKIIDQLTTTYSYDRLGRCIRENSLDYALEKTYDNLNRVTTLKEYSNEKLLTQEEYIYDAASNILSKTIYPDIHKAITSFLYDAFGREIQKTDPKGEKTYTTYILKEGSYQREVKEPGNATLIETYNPLNQVIQVENTHYGSPIALQNLKYDPCGNLIAHQTTVFKDQKPHHSYTIIYTHDSMGRKITETENDKRTTTYTYSPKGELLSLIKPSSITLHYTYTPLSHLQTLTSSDHTIDYRYTYNTKGQLLSSYDQINQTSTERTLDVYGNIIKETLANGLTLTSAFDPLSRRASLQLPNGKTIHYTYDGFYLKSVQLDSHIHTYEYDQAGNSIKEQTVGNFAIEKRYDPLNRLVKLTSPHFTQSCIYNERGNTSQMLYRDQTQDYNYDPYDHLISEPEHQYTYDSLHNRHSKDTHFYIVNDLNQIEKVEEMIHRHDLDGNLLNHQDTLLEYDALDRLIKVITPQKTYTYTYDSEHRRVKRQDDAYLWGINDHFIWDGQHELGTAQHYRILGPTEQAEIGSATILVLDDTVHVPLHDCQGNLVDILSLAGASLESRTFTAFGECPDPFAIPWGYSSKRHDSETNFVYFGRRYYDPFTGRFITADPEGYTDSYNLYAYAGNNPLCHHDLYGLMIASSTMNLLNDRDWQQTAAGIGYSGLKFASDTGYELTKIGDYSYRTLIHPFTGSDLSLKETYQNRSAYWSSAQSASHEALQNLLGADLDHAGFLASSLMTNASMNTAMLISPTRWMTKLASNASRVLNASKILPEADLVLRIRKVAGGIFQPRKAGKLSSVIAKNEGWVLPKNGGGVYQKNLLKTHLRQLEEYGANGYRRLSGGKIRYYGELDPARIKGEMAGRRMVREWNPQRGLKRTWHETLDHNGNIRIVRPETNNANKVHYVFDSERNLIEVR